MGNTLYQVSHDPFDGFVSPVKQTVDWVLLPLDQHDSLFHEVAPHFKIELPKYDSQVLKSDVSKLGFKSQSDILIRNTKISYSVPYLGNYKFDGLEGAGSHPGVDLKLLQNTPIHSIANALVYEVKKSNIGLGNYVVLLHKGVPDPNDPSKKIDIYSTYAHLDRIVVEKGDKIKKDDLIGFSGDSGLATTAHLDFQINYSDAPFLPYWPFSSLEISKQNIDFVTAVNTGVGFQDAVKYTINPFKYIQDFESFSWQTKVLSSELDAYKVEPETSEVFVVEPIQNFDIESAIDEDTNIESVNSALDQNISFSYNYDENIKYLQVSSVIFKADNDLNTSELILDYNKKDLNVKINQINSNSFRLDVTPLTFGNLPLRVNYFDSKETLNFKSQIFTDVSFDSLDNPSLKNLFDLGVLKGFNDGSINMNSNITKMEAIVFLTRLLEPEFKTTSDSWYLDYYKNAINLDLISADSEIFENVNNLEFLKLFFTYLDVDINSNISPLYNELFDESKWYSKYLQEAYRKNIISYNDIQSASDDLTRGELFTMLSRVSYILN